MVYSVQYIVYSVQRVVYIVQYVVYGVQCVVYSVQRVVYSVQYSAVKWGPFPPCVKINITSQNMNNTSLNTKMFSVWA